MSDLAATRRLVLDRVTRRQEDIVAFLQKMVRIPSVSHPPGGDEGPVQRFIEQHLKGMGLEVDVFLPTDIAGIESHEGWWPGLDYTDRPNVVGVLRGHGGGPTLILNGHCDVVSEGPRELWRDDPYGGLVKSGRVYGRGAVDMKGGLAAMIMAVSCIQDCGVRLKGDVILESAVNEELGGFNGTLACILRGYEGGGAIVTEPTDLKIEPASKGVQAYRIVIPGKGAHTGFWWEGVSALDNAIYIKKAIEDFAALRYRQTRSIALYDDPVLYPIPAVTDCVYAFRAGQSDLMSVPAEAELELMIDILPGEDLAQVTSAFEKFILDASRAHGFLGDNPVRIERVDMRPIYPTKMPDGHALITCVSENAREVLNAAPRICGFEAACDAMMFNLYSSTPAMVFGPGQLGLAHRPDEYMDIAQLVDATKIIALTILDFCLMDD